MKKVTGIGGVFFKCADAAAQRDWYREQLGIESEEWGFSFTWRDKEAPSKVGYTVWAPFSPDTKHFEPSKSPFMFNYRVADLDALFAELKAAGVETLGEVEQHENGKFAWILDPEGNKVELWEPIDPDKDPYL